MSNHANQSAGWQLEGNASEAYEQYLVPPIFAPWAEHLVETGEIHAGDRVLDVACGTGIVARRVASRVGTSGSVVGLDINDGMLAVAEDTAVDIQPSIEWRQGDAADLPFSDEGFDVVCCQQSLQFFDDPVAAVTEMRRVLAPGGRVTLSVWRPLDFQPAYVILTEALERHIGDEAGAMMRSPFPEWDGEELRTLVQDAGFDDVSVTIEIGSVRYPSVEEFVRREAASSPLAEPIAAVEQEVRDELVHEVEEALHRYSDDESIVSPMESYVVTADR
ncbi:class I SAM-dependent methyltransferase [Natronorubrum bangense]|uniref:Methyltransferase type 11 n=2 Tax=Natronorubrum bangense TaxID=61858 RepID=L9WF91_9EURY|nr:methyltransferase domain-containing protein [Natronorubrum bangense]ELY46973.1 Methyltransferase type 11 [Natronorubrum bangense JCM 10635]QCC56440.1 methyltransferase domain-containing protein [Natronorubrum bangense]